MAGWTINPGSKDRRRGFEEVKGFYGGYAVYVCTPILYESCLFVEQSST